jgi:hypothetical protein
MLACFAMPLGLLAQPEFYSPYNPPNQQQAKIGERSAKLKLNLSLDRLSYLVGEAARVTMRITNPTREHLEVFAPFIGRTTELWLYVWGDLDRFGMDHWNPLPLDYWAPMEASWMAPTIVMAPSQTMNRVLMLGGSGGFEPAGLPLPDPGRYRMSFCYFRQGNCAGTEFVVAAAQLLTFVDAANADGRFLHALVLQRKLGGQYIAVTLQERPSAAFETGPGGEIEPRMGPYIRVAEVAGPVSQLGLNVNPDNTLLVQWMESDKPKAICLSKDRSQIKACEGRWPLQPPLPIQ